MHSQWKWSLLALVPAVLLASCATTSVRYSSNPIGRLSVLGVQISESVDAANNAFTDTYTRNFLRDVAYPVAVDPTYTQLKEAAAVTLSFNDEQAGGVTYTSTLLDDMAFAEDMPGFILVLDRAMRVRGFGRGFIMDGQRQDAVVRELNRVVEDLLLNLDDQENLTYAEAPVQQQGVVTLGSTQLASGDNPADFDFQTDLKKKLVTEQRAKSGATVVESKFFTYLGKPIPNYALVRQDGQPVKLHDLLGSRKVTMLVVFISPANESMRNNYNGVGMTLQTARKVYDNFSLGQAEPGAQNVTNAHPDLE